MLRLRFWKLQERFTKILKRAVLIGERMEVVVTLEELELIICELKKKKKKKKNVYSFVALVITQRTENLFFKQGMRETVHMLGSSRFVHSKKRKIL